MATPQEKAIMVAFGKRLQELRRKRNLTQKELAEDMGVDTTTVAFIEGGTRFVHLSTLRKLAIALELKEFDELFKGIKVK